MALRSWRFLSTGDRGSRQHHGARDARESPLELADHASNWDHQRADNQRRRDGERDPRADRLRTSRRMVELAFDNPTTLRN